MNHIISARGRCSNFEDAWVELTCSCGHWHADTSPGYFEENRDEYGTISLAGLNQLAREHLAAVTPAAALLLDEDPDEALAVIRGEAKGDPAFAAVCLADAIRHGHLPAGWKPWPAARS